MEEISLALRGMRMEEIGFKLNRFKIPKDTKLDLKPTFSRRVLPAPDNEKIFTVSLNLKIEGSEEAPKPYDLKICLTGIFEADIKNEEQMRELNIRSVQILYPYLRAAVSNLTASSFVTPLVLPVVGEILFPEDKPAEGENVVS